MRHFRRNLALGVVVCAFGGGVTPAMAHQFTASKKAHVISEAEPVLTRGRGVGNIAEVTINGKTYEFKEEFIFGGNKIRCAKASTTGKVTEPEFKTLTVFVKFSECKTEVKAGQITYYIATSFNEGKPVTFAYHVNGFVELGTEVETEVALSGGAASFKISGGLCTLSWPAQTVPTKAIKHPEEEFSAAVYSNEFILSARPSLFPPNGEQEKLLIANEFKGMKFEYEGGQCSELDKTTSNAGKFFGNIQEEVSGGNLGFE
jgi:hypothetical protein